MHEPTYSTTEVCGFLGLSRTRVIQLDAELKPIVQMNGQRRYLPQNVIAYMEKRKAAAAAKAVKP